jgi:pimeloyl-ACP methyl ester carboxylesterase
MLKRTSAIIAATALVGVAAVGTAAGSPHGTGSAPHVSQVIWMHGFDAPGTPAKYDKVGVIKVTPAHGVANNVIVFEPGTSAAAAYFVPLAEWIVETVPGWQVWAIQRRESLLEDQSEMRLAKEHKTNPTQLFDYYLGFIGNSKITHHMPSSYLSLAPAYAKQWGLNVVVNDVRIVLEAAKKLGGKVVLGGHSLGGGVVTAYATWDFGGKPGADGLAGLVYDDGGSFAAESKADAQAALNTLDASSQSPWLAFGGIGAPYAGLFNDTGALSVLEDPNAPSLGQQFPLLPKD